MGRAGLTVPSDIVAIDPARAHQVASLLRNGLAPNLHHSAVAVRRLGGLADMVAESGPTATLLGDAERQLIELGLWIAAGADRAIAADVFDGGGFASLSLDDVRGFLSGDLAHWWSGSDDGFPLGQTMAGVIRVLRTAGWLQKAPGADAPVFSNGALGKGLARVLERLPATGGAGRWFASPGAVTTFKWLGVAGSATSAMIGAHRVWQRGDPFEALERDGAGYVAELAGTAFSASTTAFLIAPTPWTAGLVIGTGAVWVGAEAIDHWDEIGDWTTRRLDDLAGAAGAAWDAGAGTIGAGWDAAGDAVGGVGDAIGGIFG